MARLRFFRSNARPEGRTELSVAAGIVRWLRATTKEGVKLRKTAILGALLLALCAAVPAYANTWDVRWDGNQVTSDGADVWDVGKVTMPPTQCSIVAIDASNNGMFISDRPATGDGTSRTFFRQRGLQNTEGTTLEVRMNATYTSLDMNVCLRISSPRGEVHLGWYFNRFANFRGTVTSGSLSGFNISGYHTYRLTEDASGWKFYVDGQWKASGTLAAVPADTNDQDEIGFGEYGLTQKGELTVDYAYIELSGAYAPGAPDEPQLADLYILAAPVVTIPQSPDAATIEWDTSLPADSKVYYRQVGSPDWKTASSDDQVTHHTISLTGLQGGSPYEYYVESSDGVTLVNNYGTGYAFRKFTPNAQVRILYGYAYGAKSAFIPSGGYHFEWRCTVESDSYLYYRQVGSPTWTEIHDPTMIPRFDQSNAAATTHVIDLQTLTPGATYEWYARSTNPTWGEAQTAVGVFTYDFRITSGPEAAANADTVRITWDTTLNADEKVYYRALGSTGPWTTVVGSGVGDEHAVLITNLVVPAQYEYYVESTCLVAGFGTVQSPVRTFETYQEPGANLLTNPGFETGDLTGWTGFGQPYQVQAQGTGYHDAAPHDGLYRLYLGLQGQATPGGVYQRVTIPGSGPQVLYASVWGLTHEISYAQQWAYGYTWNEYWGTRVSDYVCIGIDPTGGTDPNSASIIWSAPVFSSGKGKPYVPIAVNAAVNGGSTATVFVKGLSDGTWKQHIVCMDDVWAGIVPAQPITDLKITENDPMSVTFTWKTPLATTSMVQYQWDGASQWWFAYSDLLTTNHSVTVANTFLPNKPIKYRAQSMSAMGLGITGLPVGTFRTSPNHTIVNGDFEAPGLAYDLDLGFGMAAVPWVRFGASTRGGVARDGTYQMHGFLSHSPTHALIFEEGYSTHDHMGGAYQQVTLGQANIGKMYQVTAKVLTHVQAPDPWVVQNRIGIDPSGGTDATSSSVIWGPWVHTSGAWGDAICAAIAREETITVFLQTYHLWPVPLNLTMFDDVSLVEAVPATSLQAAKSGTLGWPVSIGETGPGILVTKVEILQEISDQGSVNYPLMCWVQEDDRSNGIRVRLDAAPTGYLIERGDRVRIMGTTDRRDLRDFIWGEAEIVAQEINIISRGNDDPVPLDTTNKGLACAPAGIQRGATNGSGANHVGLLMKTTGKVVAQGVDNGMGYAYYFYIDDGSGLPNPKPGDPNTSYGLKVWHPDDSYYFKQMPAIGTNVAITGVSCLEVYDPTPTLLGYPDGSGDEILVPVLRMRDGNDMQIITQ